MQNYNIWYQIIFYCRNKNQNIGFKKRIYLITQDCRFFKKDISIISFGILIKFDIILLRLCTPNSIMCLKWHELSNTTE
jgi:hypothetical protein